MILITKTNNTKFTKRIFKFQLPRFIVVVVVVIVTLVVVIAEDAFVVGGIIEVILAVVVKDVTVGVLVKAVPDTPKRTQEYKSI